MSQYAIIDYDHRYNPICQETGIAYGPYTMEEARTKARDLCEIARGPDAWGEGEIQEQEGGSFLVRPEREGDDPIMTDGSGMITLYYAEIVKLQR